MVPHQTSTILQEASLDHNFITSFCEYLLFRPGSRSETGFSATQWRNEKQMVVKYVQVSCTHIARQQEIADSKMLQVALPSVLVRPGYQSWLLHPSAAPFQRHRYCCSDEGSDQCRSSKCEFAILFSFVTFMLTQPSLPDLFFSRSWL